MAEGREYDDSVVTVLRTASAESAASDSVVTVLRTAPAESAASDNSIVTVVSKLPAILAAEDARTVAVQRSEPVAEVERTEPDAVPSEPIVKQAVTASVLAPPLRSAPTLPTVRTPAGDLDTAVTFTVLDEETFTAARPEQPLGDAAGSIGEAAEEILDAAAVVPVARPSEPVVRPSDPVVRRGDPAVQISEPVVRPIDVPPSTRVPVPIFDPTLRIDKERARPTAPMMAPRTAAARRLGDVALAIAVVGAVIVVAFVAAHVLREEPPSARESASSPAHVTRPATPVEPTPESAPAATEAPPTPPPPTPAPAIDRASKKRPAPAKSTKKKSGWDPDSLFPD